MDSIQSTIAALDIGHQYIKGIVAFSRPENDEEGFSEIYGSIEKTSGYRKNGVIQKNKLENSLKLSLDSLVQESAHEITHADIIFSHPKLQFQKKSIRQNVSSPLTINSSWFQEKELILRDKINRIFPEKRVVHFEFVSLSIDNEEVSLDDQESHIVYKTVKTTFIFILAPSTFYEVLKESVDNVIESSTLKPSMIIYNNQLEEDEAHSGVIVCDVGHVITNVSLYKNGYLYDAEVLPFGAFNITNVISQILNISIKDAEKVQQDITNEIATIKKSDMLKIERKLKTDLKDMCKKHPIFKNAKTNVPYGMFLVGGGGGFHNMTKIFNAATGLHTERLMPQSSIQVDNTSYPDVAWSPIYSYVKYLVNNQSNEFWEKQNNTGFLSRFFNAITGQF